jgi:pantoate--beta-alanine ligase
LKILRSIPATRRFCKASPGPVVLVPTMGALHAGHAALIGRARSLAGSKGRVVVSIFVNPAQFGPAEDLDRYPRPFKADRALCARFGADAIFHPAPAAMYAPGHSTWVTEENASRGLCGASRPGHFRGVCTVVLKLFTITAPAVAVFGQKDFQQCAVIRRMVRDLNLPVRIVMAPTVRESDGLALSSRNVYLNADERRQAPIVYRSLLAARSAWRRGVRDPEKLRRLIQQSIASAAAARIDYIEIVSPDSLEAVSCVEKGTVIAAAAFFRKTRLIDNLRLS